MSDTETRQPAEDLSGTPQTPETVPEEYTEENTSCTQNPEEAASETESADGSTAEPPQDSAEPAEPEPENPEPETEPEPDSVPLQEEKKNGRGKTVLLILGIAILVILLAVGGSFLAALRLLRGDDKIPIIQREDTYQIPETMEDTIVPLDSEDLATMTEPVTEEPPETTAVPEETEAVTEPVKTPIYEKDKTSEHVINVLLLGRDARNAAVEYGRTDSMIILSYNQETHNVKLISLMRDMLIPIEGHDWNRINTAHAFGGPGMCINTLNDVFKLDIQNYITVDFNGLISIIDTIGGIDINLTADEVALYQAYGSLDASAKPGINHLNGKQTLTHAQNRSLGADFGRTDRHRAILMAIFDKVTSSLSVSEVTSLVKTVLNIVSTNLPLADLTSLAIDVMNSKDEISFTSARLPFADTYHSAWYKKMLVIEFDIEENVKKLHELLYES